ncbi:hypothetical protein [Mucilaginibacter sp. OK098]|uniref:hypothetical protein n=1 Tax=Mucilaginibacter sp. OK098 TaxID=1855297 RepID=UPI000919DF1A|nr:hypothetical protein [Mucilaginibacter sp. OK098]SHN26164.1 hypothetical protein SAMN05216524_107384 [Mucilaginibacter sp. OK098]
MLPDDLNELYTLLYYDLVAWVSDNPKLDAAITQKDRKQLFAFDNTTGLLIDLTRFEESYYRRVFGDVQKSDMTERFINTVCLIIKESLIRTKQYDATIPIAVKKHIGGISAPKRYYIHPKYTPHIRTSAT